MLGVSALAIPLVLTVFRSIYILSLFSTGNAIVDCNFGSSICTLLNDTTGDFEWVRESGASDAVPKTGNTVGAGKWQHPSTKSVLSHTSRPYPRGRVEWGQEVVLFFLLLPLRIIDDVQ